MMPLRRASVIATLSLLAWATTASAECAWVLWIESEAISPRPSGTWQSAWFSRNVHMTRKACDEALVEHMEIEAEGMSRSGIKVFRPGEDSSGYKDHFLRIDIVGRSTTQVWAQKGEERRSVLVKQYNCLPDTVDPRGPKGK